MVIKVFISGISGSKEVKKRQQESLLILDTIKIDYKVIDITEPGHEEERDLMKEVCKKRNSDALPLSPQFFNDDEYCGDWEDFFAASDDDKVHSFLKLEEPTKCELSELLPSNGTPEVSNEKDNFNAADIILSDEENEVKNSDVEEAPETTVVADQEAEEVEEEVIALSPPLGDDDMKKDVSDVFEEEAVEE